MSARVPARYPDQLCGCPDDDLAACIRAEQMLDHYGVAYVCQHPEILVGVVPPIDSGYGAHGSGQVYGRNARDAYLLTLVRGYANHTEDLSDRTIEAYRTLDEIFRAAVVNALRTEGAWADSDRTGWEVTRL